MKTIKIIILISFLIFLNSCKDKPNEQNEPKYCLMSQEFKDYTVFSVGDYWVYKSNTGEKDSVVLIKQEITSEQMEEQHSNYKFEELKQTFVINNTDTFYMYGGLYSFKNCKYTYGPNNSITTTTTMGRLFYPCNINESISDVSYIQNYDTLTINNILYNQIKVYSYYGNKYFFSKNIGLVRRIFNDAIIWDIENYNINK